MKVVSTAKFSKAEKELREAKAYGAGAKGMYVCQIGRVCTVN